MGTRSHHLGRGKVDELGLRHRPPILRHVLLLHQPGHRPARAVEREGLWKVREEGVRAAKAPRREGRRAALGEAWSQAHHPHQGPGRLHQRPRRGTLQASRLQVLSKALLYSTNTQKCTKDEGASLSSLSIFYQFNKQIKKKKKKKKKKKEKKKKKKKKKKS